MGFLAGVGGSAADVLAFESVLQLRDEPITREVVLVQPSCSRKLVEPDQTARPTFKSTLVRRPSRVGPSQSIIWSHHNVHLVTLEWAIGATLLSIWSRHPRRRVGFLRVNSQDSSPLRMTSGAHPVESRSLLPAMTGAMSKANQSGI